MRKVINLVFPPCFNRRSRWKTLTSLCLACTSLGKDVKIAIRLHSKAIDATAEGGEGLCKDVASF